MADSPDSEPVSHTPLSRLLKNTMTSNGWTLRDVTRPPEGTRPGGPPRATISHYLQPNRWLKTGLRPQTIQELAQAILVSPSEILAASRASHESMRDVEEIDPASMFVTEWLTEDYLIRVVAERLDGARASDADRDPVRLAVSRFYSDPGYVRAARSGETLHAQMAAAEPDPNVDPPAPDDPS